MYTKITSTKNPKVKNVLLLQDKARERRKQHLFVIEGIRETTLAVRGGYVLKQLFFCPEIADMALVTPLMEQPGLEIYEVEDAVFEKMAYRESSGGIVALAEPKPNRLQDIKLSENPLIMILEGVEKPGNLGALLRTADAAHLDAVIICDPTTDFYNPNAIRSSIGCVFTNQIAAATNQETFAWLKEHGIRAFATALTASDYYHRSDYRGPSAIVMGTEATGLTQEWIEAADERIIIPMRGEIDSMNVSTAAAVVVFEAARQRDFQY